MPTWLAMTGWYWNNALMTMMLMMLGSAGLDARVGEEKLTKNVEISNREDNWLQAHSVTGFLKRGGCQGRLA